MEEQQERRNVGEKEGGQQSKNSGETGPEPEEHRIDIVEISPRVKNWIESLNNAEESTQSQSQWPRIPKVPHILRGTKDFKKLYEPRVISIGPYHHGKPHLHQGEKIKRRYAQKFLGDRNRPDIEALYTKILSKIEEVRNCYDTNKYDDEALAWMMLLDGCFLVYFIHCVGEGNQSKLHDLNVKDHMIAFVHQDLFLLENQLPFGVLELISKRASLTMENMIKGFFKITKGLTSEIQLEGHSHLLGLLRSALLGSKKEERSRPEQEQEGMGGFCCPLKKQYNWPSFRHIKELKAAGIYVKPSGTSSLRDVSFNSCYFYGNLNLPPITIDDSTKPMFLNMVAYEMCPEGPDDYGVASYICFLDKLIDHADDVKELRSKHILYNYLGSDEDVAQIFNEIANDLVGSEAYEGVKVRIQEHYKKRVSTWIAQALHDYFSTPWTFMAFIGALSILVLTAVQTYFASR